MLYEVITQRVDLRCPDEIRPCASPRYKVRVGGGIGVAVFIGARHAQPEPVPARHRHQGARIRVDFELAADEGGVLVGAAQVIAQHVASGLRRQRWRRQLRLLDHPGEASVGVIDIDVLAAQGQPFV